VLRSLTDLAKVYRPPADDQVRDRRAAVTATTRGLSPSGGKGVSTRRQTTRAAAAAAIDDPATLQEREQESITESFHSSEEQEPITCDRTPPEMYREAEGEVRLQNVDFPARLTQLSKDNMTDDLADLAPFAYYFSPGWYQTGMHYVGHVLWHE
jgi:hypothetical protein